jgi:hypothetical protein
LDGTPSLRISPPADFADARHEAVVRRVGDRTRFDDAMKQCRNKSAALHLTRASAQISMIAAES